MDILRGGVAETDIAGGGLHLAVDKNGQCLINWTLYSLYTVFTVLRLKALYPLNKHVKIAVELI